MNNPTGSTVQGTEATEDTVAVEHDDARYQFWVDIEREQQAELDEFYREVVWDGNPPADVDEDEEDDSPHQ